MIAATCAESDTGLSDSMCRISIRDLEQVQLMVSGAEGHAGESFDGQGECRGFAFIAEIGQGGPVVAGPEGQGGRRAGSDGGRREQ